MTRQRCRRHGQQFGRQQRVQGVPGQESPAAGAAGEGRRADCLTTCTPSRALRLASGSSGSTACTRYTRDAARRPFRRGRGAAGGRRPPVVLRRAGRRLTSRRARSLSAERWARQAFSPMWAASPWALARGTTFATWCGPPGPTPGHRTTVAGPDEDIGEGHLKTFDLRPAGRRQWVSSIRWPPSSPFADPATMRMSALLLRGQAICRGAV